MTARSLLARGREVAGCQGRHEPVVYYLGSTLGGVVKIGTSTDLASRIARLLAAQPALDPVLYATEPGDWRVERQRHQQLSEHRQTGEWYWLTREVRLWICDVATAEGRKAHPHLLATRR